MWVVRAGPECRWGPRVNARPGRSKASFSHAAVILTGALLASPVGLWAAQAPAAGAAPAPRVLNVRDFGAVGNGVTVDTAAVQKAVNSAQPGDAIYFPAGTYALGDSIEVPTSQLTFYGDGPASVLVHGGHRGLDLGSSTVAPTGLVVQRLKFVGLPGQYMADNNHTPSIQIFGQGTQISDCDFQGSGFAVASVLTASGTQIVNCRVMGWGVAGILCNGGEQVSQCQLIQDDPNLAGGHSGPGIWISTAAANVQVADTVIRNARTDGIELYGTDPNTRISNVQLLRCTIQDSNEGILLQPGLAETGEAQNVLIQDCTLTGTYDGPALSIRGGEGIVIRNNQIQHGKNAALALGRWGSSEWGFTVKNLQFTSNSVQDCGSGVFALATSGGHLMDIVLTGNSIASCKEGIAAIASFGGDFTNVTIGNNSFTDCPVNLDLDQAGPGITLSP